jgi:DeoR/GlpR family transcriptional regulator of sugar metabolism
MAGKTKIEENVTSDAKDAAEYALPARRRSELLKIAKSRGSIAVVEIAQLFGISADTARRDLDYLESRGLLRRTHGGAVPVDGFIDRDAPLAARLNSRAAEKTRIARAAAALIVDGETLLINGGSTTRAFAGELGARRNLTIVTNNLGIPGSVPPNSARAVYLLGGHVRQELQVTIGAVGFPDAGPISADTAVIGVGGISSRGLSTTLLEEASMIRAMMDSARRVILLADSAKFGASVFAHIAPLEQVDVLVTEARPPTHLASVMADAGVDIIVAD